MYALVSPEEKIKFYKTVVKSVVDPESSKTVMVSDDFEYEKTGRVCEIVATQFPVASPLFWVEVGDELLDVNAVFYNSESGQVEVFIPPETSESEQQPDDSIEV